MKRLIFSLVVALGMILFSGSARATDISFAGNVTISQGGTAGTPMVNFTFSHLTVTAGTLGGDALEGTWVSITPSTTFSFSQISGGVGLFSPNSGTFSIGNSTTGMLSGTITFVKIVEGGLNGTFAIQVGLSDISVTHGTSALLNGFESSLSGGSGALTFQFTAPNATGLNDLLHLGLGTGTLGSSGSIRTSVSGSVTVPEPASLALLGTGLLAGGRMLRRKMLTL